MRRIAVVAAFVLASVPAFAQDKATVDRLNDAFAQAFNRSDTAALAAMYMEDAYLLPPQADLVHGREAIGKFWAAAGEQVGDLKLTAVDVKPLGNDAAREIGTFSLRTKGQQPQEMAGKYVVVWQKAGGDWKLATDIWNTNK